VWNKFLLSPLEFARYIDSFESPYVKAYFDVGNVAISGYPQDWIRVLGKRIVKLHIKDFKFERNVASWVSLKEGQINWRAVYAALEEINYKGTATVELAEGDGAYLKEVNRRFEQILSGE
jgi:L-ribulose-5-phosphate 3-epimerase